MQHEEEGVVVVVGEVARAVVCEGDSFCFLVREVEDDSGDGFVA